MLPLASGERGSGTPGALGRIGSLRKGRAAHLYKKFTFPVTPSDTELCW